MATTSKSSAAAIVIAIDAAVLANAGNEGPVELSIDGRTVKFDMEKLMKVRATYAAIADAADLTTQSPFPHRTLLRPKRD